MTAVASPKSTARRAPARHRGHPRQRRLSVVDTTSVQAARRVRRLMTFGFILVASALVTAVVFHVTLAQGQSELDALRDEAALQQERYERLRVEVATASAPEVIRQRAAAIGLVEPEEIIHVSPVPGSVEVSPDSLSTTSATGNWPTVKPHLGDQP